MKKIILIFSLIALVGCKSKKAHQKLYKKHIETEEITEDTKDNKEGIDVLQLALTDVDNSQKTKAYELGKRILMTCNTSKFKPFNSSEATQSVIDNITLEKLSKTCIKFRQWYGTFKDIQLKEIYKSNNDGTTLFRYKALYTKKVANKELRVYMNEENKVSSIKTMDWTDTFIYK
jgi:hypothetical protein